MSRHDGSEIPQGTATPLVIQAVEHPTGLSEHEGDGVADFVAERHRLDERADLDIVEASVCQPAPDAVRVAQ